MSRCPSAACASGRRAKMTGLDLALLDQRPDALAQSGGDSPFRSVDWMRSVDPVIVSHGDDRTVLPEGLTRPAHWSKSEGNKRDRPDACAACLQVAILEDPEIDGVDASSLVEVCVAVIPEAVAVGSIWDGWPATGSCPSRRAPHHRRCRDRLGKARPSPRGTYHQGSPTITSAAPSPFTSPAPATVQPK